MNLRDRITFVVVTHERRVAERLGTIYRLERGVLERETAMASTLPVVKLGETEQAGEVVA